MCDLEGQTDRSRHATGSHERREKIAMRVSVQKKKSEGGKRLRIAQTKAGIVERAEKT